MPLPKPISTSILNSGRTRSPECHLVRKSTRQARDKLEAAQQAFSSQQQKTGVIAVEERLDYETAKLSELSTQLTAAQD